MGLWNRLTRTLGLADEQPAVPDGLRVYAVGDVHGRLDLLDAMLARIAADRQAAPVERTVLIFLGDLVDRGPESAAVVERLRTLENSLGELHLLMGNHEEAFLGAVAGEDGWLPNWLDFGGDATAASYGVAPGRLAWASEADGAAMLAAGVPAAHLDFLRRFEDAIAIGDYLFVHAGIRPGVPVSQQAPHDLRWIREPFLSDPKPHGPVVVHGHTIVDEVQDRGNRIGIDTGAYRSGRLTALVLEGTDRRYLVAEGAAGVALAAAADRT
jgi:serine/threonine protein phosphatase 1